VFVPSKPAYLQTLGLAVMVRQGQTLGQRRLVTEKESFMTLTAGKAVAASLTGRSCMQPEVQQLNLIR
jgi:hypothetical protein